MAMKGSQGRVLAVFHLLSRCLGLLALGTAIVGIALVQLALIRNKPQDDGKADLIETITAHWNASGELIREVLESRYSGDLVGVVATWMIAIAIPVMALALIIELLALLTMAAGRRTLAGTLVLVQVAMAVFVLVSVNYYSFQNYKKIDCTQPTKQGAGQFTLPEDVQTRLRTLQRETTIVVLQRPSRSTDPNEDAYVEAAETVIVQKVRDLAEMMREFGPQFRVVVLDPKNKAFKTQLAQQTHNRPKLAEAIQQATGSSIFFYSELEAPKVEGTEQGAKRAYVRQLSFDDFYKLDKSRSLKTDQSDLVLQEKGLNRFINCVLNIDEKRPRVGILVIHELLSSQSSHREYSCKGVRESLTRDGYDVVDIVTVRWQPRREPGVETVEETRYVRLTEQIKEEETEKARWEKNVKALKEVIPEWTNKTLEMLEKEYAGLLAANDISRLTPEYRKQFIELFQRQLDQQEQLLARLSKSLADAKQERDGLNVDAASVQQRMTDIQAKLRQSLAECDLLLIPRLTMMGPDEIIPYNLHRVGFDAGQATVIKEYLAQGKPILACFGPSNEPPRRPDPSIDRPGQDEIEQLFAELGIEFGRQTLLYPDQMKDYSARGSSIFRTTEPSKIPPLDFQKSPAVLARPGEQGATEQHPLRQSLALTGQGLGKQMDLSLRFARPVYYDPDVGKRGERYRNQIGAVLATAHEGPLAILPALALQPEPRKNPNRAPEFLLTTADAWNDPRPFPAEDRRVPRYQKPKDDDPARGTPDEMRLGTFPVGVAVEADIPDPWKESWRESQLLGGAGGPMAAVDYRPRVAERKTVRVIGIGQGSWIVDEKLDPAREALLRDSCNWLLGREERLNKPSPDWTYPRVEMARDEKYLWVAGGWLGLPLLFGLLGVLVLLARGVR